MVQYIVKKGIYYMTTGIPRFWLAESRETKLGVDSERGEGSIDPVNNAVIDLLTEQEVL